MNKRAICLLKRSLLVFVAIFLQACGSQPYIGNEVASSSFLDRTVTRTDGSLTKTALFLTDTLRKATGRPETYPDGSTQGTSTRDLDRALNIVFPWMRTTHQFMDIDLIHTGLERKDFIASTKLTQGQITRADFIDVFEDLCTRASPFMAFLCSAVDVEY